jgi:glycerophosphoryl diester phosphodiesterase
VNLRHPGGRPLVIGHRGAAAEAPENTLESLAAAVAVGADLVEFDVDEGLLVGHPGRPAAAGPLTLDAALTYLAGTPIGIQLDLKIAGGEREIAALVARHSLGDRVVVSSNSTRVLRRLAGEAPELLRAIGYPRDRAGVAGAPWPRPVVRAAVAAVGPLVRARVPLLLSSARAGVLCLHHGLVTPELLTTVHSRGAALVAWTVNEPDRVSELARLGADAITSDDPRMVVGVLARLPGR